MLATTREAAIDPGTQGPQQTQVGPRTPPRCRVFDLTTTRSPHLQPRGMERSDAGGGECMRVHSIPRRALSRGFPRDRSGVAGSPGSTAGRGPERGQNACCLAANDRSGKLAIWRFHQAAP